MKVNCYLSYSWNTFLKSCTSEDNFLFFFLPYMKIQSHIGIVHLCTILFSNYFKLYFWIIHHVLLFSNPPIHISPLSFSQGPFLHKLFWMHICIYIFLNIACWVHLMLPVCMILGLTFWHWKTNCFLILGELPFPVPSFPQLPIILYVGLRPHGLFSEQIDIFIDFILVQLTLWQSWWEDFMDVISDVSRRYNLTTTYWSSGHYNLSVLFSQCFLSLRGGSL